jgi:hypothetical protein
MRFAVSIPGTSMTELMPLPHIEMLARDSIWMGDRQNITLSDSKQGTHMKVLCRPGVEDDGLVDSADATRHIVYSINTTQDAAASYCRAK